MLQVLRAELQGNTLYVEVWLDTGRQVWDVVAAIDETGAPVNIRVGEGRPDPSWVVTYEFGPAARPEEGDYLPWSVPHQERCVRTALLNAEGELTLRSPDAPIRLDRWHGATIDRSDILNLTTQPPPP